MLKIGITGGIGSGKSTAADFFRSQQAEVIDLDQLARIVVNQGSAAHKDIQSRFGDHILDQQGELDRRKLAEIIFANPAEKHWLESLLHPLINAEKQRILSTSQSAYAVIEIPLLTENQLQDTVDRVLLIDCDEKTQRERALARGNQSEQQIKKIMASQASRSERTAIADDLVQNNGAPKELIAQLWALHQKYLKLAETTESEN